MADGVTADLARAIELGTMIDAELDGRDEVRVLTTTLG